MAKSLTLDEVVTTLAVDADAVKLDFNVTFPKNQVHVVVTPKLRGDNVATLTDAADKTTLKFVSAFPTIPPTEVTWTITLTADFDTKILRASGKGNKSDYSFEERIATW